MVEEGSYRSSEGWEPALQSDKDIVTKSALFDEDELKEHVWGYLVPLLHDTQNGGRCVGLRKRGHMLPEKESSIQRLQWGYFPPGGYLIGRDPDCGRFISELPFSLVFDLSYLIDIIINDPFVSNRHCLLFPESSKVFLEDLSSNGKFVNNDVVGRNQRRERKFGDKITVLDRARFIFRYPSTTTSLSSKEYGFPLKVQRLYGEYWKIDMVDVCVENPAGEQNPIGDFTPSRKAKWSWRDAWNRDISVSMSVRHPNILGLNDVLIDGLLQKGYLIKERTPGGPLFDYIVAKKKLSEDEIRGVFAQLFDAIRHLVCILSGQPNFANADKEKQKNAACSKYRSSGH